MLFLSSRLRLHRGRHQTRRLQPRNLRRGARHANVLAVHPWQVPARRQRHRLPHLPSRLILSGLWLHLAHTLVSHCTSNHSSQKHQTQPLLMMSSNPALACLVRQPWRNPFQRDRPGHRPQLHLGRCWPMGAHRLAIPGGLPKVRQPVDSSAYPLRHLAVLAMTLCGSGHGWL